MRYFFSLFLVGFIAIPGCGGASPEEADTSHLSMPKEAEDAAAAARAKYDSAGKEGPAQ